MLGRRGPAQAAFTNPELRELGEMKDADVDVDPAEVELDELSRAYLDSDEADITTRKNVEIFTEFSQRQPEGKRRRIVLRFLRSPVEIQGDGKVERLIVARNELYRDESGAIRASRHRRARDDRVRARLPLDRLQGGRAGGDPVRRAPRRDPQPGRQGDRSRERRAGRRASTPSAGSSAARRASSGPTRRTPRRRSTTCSRTCEAGRVPAPAAADRRRSESCSPSARPTHVTYSGWEAIDRAEQERGKPLGRPRVKFVRIEEMLEAARSGAPGVRLSARGRPDGDQADDRDGAARRRGRGRRRDRLRRPPAGDRARAAVRRARAGSTSTGWCAPRSSRAWTTARSTPCR